MPVALVADRGERRERVVAVAQRHEPRRLGERGQVVRQPDPLQVLHDRGVAEHVARAARPPCANAFEKVRTTATFGSRSRQRQRALAAELDVGLVDHDERAGQGLGERADGRHRLRVARSGCSASTRRRRRARPRPPPSTWSTVRTKSAGQPQRRVRCVREPATAACAAGTWARRSGCVPSRPAVGRQELGEDLVRPARDPHAVDGVTVDVARSPRGASRICPSG